MSNLMLDEIALTLLSPEAKTEIENVQKMVVEEKARLETVRTAEREGIDAFLKTLKVFTTFIVRDGAMVLAREKRGNGTKAPDIRAKIDGVEITNFNEWYRINGGEVKINEKTKRPLTVSTPTVLGFAEASGHVVEIINS